MTDDAREPTPVNAPVKQSPRWLVPVIVGVLVLVSIGVYVWRDQQAKTQQKKLQDQITALQAKLNAQSAESTTETQQPAPTTTNEVPSTALVDTIKAVFASGNTAALEGYMASSVKVVVAASEGLGDRTPIQAVNDITSYMANATDPWSFDLPAATLKKYQTGDYAQYFPENAVVGKSDEMVVSFTFNDAGKISGVLLCNAASVL